jgi:hypothetical protein
MSSYLTKGEIEASKQRLPYACLFKEASIDKKALARDRRQDKKTT